MPDRMIRESVLTSRSLTRCSQFADLLWPRLFLITDAYGRFDAEPCVVRNRLFPMRDDVTAQQVAEALDDYAREGMMRRWRVGETLVGALVNFDRCQTEATRFRKKPSVFPDPEHPDLPEIHGDSPRIAEDHGDSLHGEGEGVGDGDGDGSGDGEGVRRPRIDDVPREVLRRAEQFLGRPLSQRDLQTLVNWVFTVKFPATWILRSMSTPRAQGKGLEYLAPIMREYAARGGPPSEQPPAHQQATEQDPLPAAAAELVAAGLTERQARDLVATCPADVIREQLEWLPLREGLQNPAAFLVKAIREGAAPPPAVLEQRRAEESLAHSRRENEARRRKTAAFDERRKRCEDAIRALRPDERTALQGQAEQRVRDRGCTPLRGLVHAAEIEIVAERLGLPPD